MAHTLKRHAPRLITGSTRAVLGEGPVWDERTQRLLWVDIERGELHGCQADGSNACVLSIGERIGCIALRRDKPGVIAGLERSIALIGLDPLEIHTVVMLDSHPKGNRCNDGKCDAQGRFWVGTYNTAETSATGWLFRFEATAGLTRMIGPYVCTNGPAFSPDGRTAYCVDSHCKLVHQFDMTPSGDLSNPRIFKSFDEQGWGYPDGLTCDSEGCVWIAHWGGARVSRFNPGGELLGEIPLPVTQPTSCTFGGSDLRCLYVTSASVGLDAHSNINGLAGAVFAVDLAVPGLPAARFNG